MQKIAIGLVVFAFGFIVGRFSEFRNPTAIVKVYGEPVARGEIEWGFFSMNEPRELAERACGEHAPLRNFKNTDSVGLTNWYAFECSASE